MKAMMMSLVGRMASARCVLANSLRNWRHTRQTLREINALGAQEAGRVLTEVGLSPREFERSMVLPFASEDLLQEAMHTFDIDPDEFCARYPGWFQDMERTCMKCPHRGACRRIVARGRFAEWHRGVCPNAEDFAQIASPAVTCG
ncbi:hypothetical protein N1F89_06100 [Aquibium sp. A9E412]|uniref:hypothetical protein n=1 Tax=Aquibium sp. A9E412 TaxID=2976767 RepID=UPI0025AFA1CC|nr:hypothetical protein [Aquibium sp. A9E412]MDN2565787.1 hypothetical protein [Aquibium sp. A9E412]